MNCNNKCSTTKLIKKRVKLLNNLKNRLKVRVKEGEGHLLRVKYRTKKQKNSKCNANKFWETTNHSMKGRSTHYIYKRSLIRNEKCLSPTRTLKSICVTSPNKMQSSCLRRISLTMCHLRIRIISLIDSTFFRAADTTIRLEGTLILLGTPCTDTVKRIKKDFSKTNTWLFSGCTTDAMGKLLNMNVVKIRKRNCRYSKTLMN